MSLFHYAKGSEHPTFPDNEKLRLYSMRFCPYAHRSHLILDAKKIPYNSCYINVDADKKPEWYLNKVAPPYKVPALEFPQLNTHIVESLIICDFLDEKYPETPLQSSDPLQRAFDRMLVERFNNVAMPFFRFVFAEKDEDKVKHFKEMNENLDVFEEELKKRGTKFFFGSKPGMLDYMIWPWFERIDILKHYANGQYDFDEARYPMLLKWKNLMHADEAVKIFSLPETAHLKFWVDKVNKVLDYNFLL